MTEIKELLERLRLGVEALVELSEKTLTEENSFLFNYYRSRLNDNLHNSAYYYAAWMLREHSPSLDYLFELTKHREEPTHKLELFNLSIESNDIELAIKIAVDGIHYYDNFNNYFTLLGISLGYKYNRPDLTINPFFYTEGDLRYKLNNLL